MVGSHCCCSQNICCSNFDFWDSVGPGGRASVFGVGHCLYGHCVSFIGGTLMFYFLDVIFLTFIVLISLF